MVVESKAGCGHVIKNHWGEVILSACHVVHGVSSLLHVELHAILFCTVMIADRSKISNLLSDFVDHI